MDSRLRRNDKSSNNPPKLIYRVLSDALSGILLQPEKSRIYYARKNQKAKQTTYLKNSIRMIRGSFSVITRLLCLVVSAPKYSKQATSR